MVLLRAGGEGAVLRGAVEGRMVHGWVPDARVVDVERRVEVFRAERFIAWWW